MANRISGLWWLSYGQEFGLSSPLSLDLSILKISFSFMIKINIASIIGLIIAIIWYRKV